MQDLSLLHSFTSWHHFITQSASAIWAVSWLQHHLILVNCPWGAERDLGEGKKIVRHFGETAPSTWSYHDSLRSTHWTVTRLGLKRWGWLRPFSWRDVLWGTVVMWVYFSRSVGQQVSPKVNFYEKSMSGLYEQLKFWSRSPTLCLITLTMIIG